MFAIAGDCPKGTLKKARASTRQQSGRCGKRPAWRVEYERSSATFATLTVRRGGVGDHDHEVEEARWFRISEAINVLKFATERRMVQRALAVLTAPDRQP